jgi:hypothetical protein
METSEITAYVCMSFCLSVLQTFEIFNQFTDFQEKVLGIFKKLNSHPGSDFLIYCNNQSTDDAHDKISI